MLVIDQQRIQLDSLYRGIGDHCALDLRRLSSKQQDNLARYFSEHVELERYHRVILFLRFKKEIRQLAFICSLPNLVILEHDAWQNFYSASKYQGKFSRHYSAIPWARVLVSGATLAEKLRQQGYDANFVPKGYDQTLLVNNHQSRDITLGFVGNTEHDTYKERKQFLTLARTQLGLQSMRTNSGEDYLQALNKIRYFLSADIGFGENMVKNFEAMACGCLLIAFDQGEIENQTLGFIDMKNVVLYRDINSLTEKLRTLQQDSELSDRVADAGQLLAEQYYQFSVVGEQVVKAITPELRSHQITSLWKKLQYQFRR